MKKLFLITSNALDHWRQPVESELTADFQSDWQAQLGGNFRYLRWLAGWFFITGLFLSFNAFANELNIIAQTDSNDASTKCGNNCTWTLYSDGTLKINGSGDMENYKAPYMSEGKVAPWSEYASDINNVTIEDGITSIGAWSFYQTAVSNVNLADSIIKINDGSFAYCKNLSEIKLPKNLVSLSSQVFQGTSLQSINIPASVNNVGSHTFAISSLQSITLSDNTLFDASAFWDRGAEYPHQLEIYCKGNFSKCQSNISNSFKKDIFAPAHTPEHPNIDTAYHTIHLNKRIYTVEEASRLSKPTGNTFKIRYK